MSLFSSSFFALCADHEHFGRPLESESGEQQFVEQSRASQLGASEHELLMMRSHVAQEGDLHLEETNGGGGGEDEVVRVRLPFAHRVQIRARFTIALCHAAAMVVLSGHNRLHELIVRDGSGGR